MKDGGRSEGSNDSCPRSARLLIASQKRHHQNRPVNLLYNRAWYHRRPFGERVTDQASNAFSYHSQRILIWGLTTLESGSPIDHCVSTTKFSPRPELSSILPSLKILIQELPSQDLGKGVRLPQISPKREKMPLKQSLKELCSNVWKQTPHCHTLLTSMLILLIQKISFSFSFFFWAEEVWWEGRGENEKTPKK